MCPPIPPGYNPKLLAQLGPAAEGFIVTSLAPGLDDNKNLPAFLERWNAEVKRPPNGLPYLQYNYDSVLIAAKLYKYVLDKDQTPTGDTLREALLTIREFDGPLTGKTVVDGHHVKKPVYLLTVENGKFVPMATIDIASADSCVMTDPIVLLQILWTGAVTASSYVLLTVAFSLTQKVTGLWNFAQAGTMGIAFYTMFFVLNDLGPAAVRCSPGGRRARRGHRDRDRGLGPRCAARAPLRQSDVLHLHADPGRVGDLHPDLAVRHRAADTVHEHHVAGAHRRRHRDQRLGSARRRHLRGSAGRRCSSS